MGKRWFRFRRLHVRLERTRHMADTIALGKKARILVSGEPITTAGFTSASSGDEAVFLARINDPDGFWRVYPVAAGTATLTVDINGHEGTDEITVTEAPLEVSLDTPEDA